VLWAVLGGLFATSFSITILAVSLGDIARDLGSSKSALTWTITGPFLALAMCMPLFGKLGDLYGHRRLYLLGLSGFTIATVLTAFAWSGPSLIAFRVLGGIPAAAVGPASMAIIMRAFPGRDRVKAMSWWSFVGAAGPVTGLIAGGPLVDALGWRWVFIVQAPLALLGLAVAVMVVRETPRAPAEPIDWAGAGSLAAASFMLLLALSLTGDLGWTNPVVIGLAVAALVALWSFVRVELRARHPLVPLDLFRRHNFRMSLIGQFGSNFAYMGGFIITPVLVREQFGFTVAAASLAMALRPIVNGVVSPIGGYFALRVGERRVSVIGAVVVMVSMGCFIAAAQLDAVGIVFVGLVLSGVGAGLTGPPLITVAANAVEPQRLGIANAAQQTVSQIGAIFGIQALSAILGGSTSASAFALAYGVGAVVAVTSIYGSGRVHSTLRRPALRVTSAAA